jgi:hypothetical protein
MLRACFDRLSMSGVGLIESGKNPAHAEPVEARALPFDTGAFSF